MVDPVRRAGATVSEQGASAALGWHEIDPMKHGEGSYVHQAESQRLAALRVVERLHKQNEAVRTARAMGKPAVVPEPAVRSKLARAEFKVLAHAQSKIDALEQEMALKKSSLDPFMHKKSTLIDVARRQELRQALRSMKPEERNAKLREIIWQSAAIEMPPELSAVAPSEWEQLREQAQRLMCPEDCATIDDTLAVTAAAKQTLKAARIAAQNELAAIGETLAERPEPAQAAQWA